MRPNIVALILLGTLLSSCSCWWEMGHMLTAAVAQIKLQENNPEIFDKFNSLIKSMNPLCQNTSWTFIESSVWPDDIKGANFGMTLWNDWHFIDSPYVYDGVVPIVNYSQGVSNSVYIINQTKKVLTTNIDKNTAERALMARYLVHLAGDIHQPLHSVAFFNASFPKGDQGGNLLKIKLPGNATEGNFHSYWDAGAYLLQKEDVKRPLTDDDTNKLIQQARDLIQEVKKADAAIETLGQILEPQEWAIESFRIAQNTTYPRMLVTIQADQLYVNTTYETCKKRVVLGGLRLYNLIVKIYTNSTELAKETLQPADDKWFFDRVQNNQVVPLQQEVM